MKNSKWSQKGLKFQYVALNVACWMKKKFLCWNKLRKMKCLWNRWVFVWNPLTFKEMVQFVHEVHPVFVVILSTFAHMLCWSNDDTMQVSTFSQLIALVFQFQGHLAQNNSLNALKIANEVRKGWNFSMWLWMLHVGCNKNPWVEISLEKWNAFETDEFSPKPSYF